MPEEQIRYRQTRTYELQLKIKNLDYTQDVVDVTINSSLSTAYQVVSIRMLIDPYDVILESVYGNEPVYLTVSLLTEESVPTDSVIFELMYLKSNTPLFERGTSSEARQRERVPFDLTFVSRPSYQTMMTVVNGVYIGSTLSSIINDLASQASTTVIYDSNGQNTESLDQVCVPPITFYKAIKEYMVTSGDFFDGYLDQRFGLFDGVPGVFCQYDNKVYIKNLTQKLKQNQAFTVYQLTTESSDDNQQEIIEDSGDGKTFYTYDQINTDYSANARIANIGSQLNHIVKPRDAIAGIVQQDIINVAQNYSLVFKNSNLDYDRGVERQVFLFDDTGYETSRTLFNSRYGRRMSDMSTISFRLERNLPVLNLLNVGEAVKFKPKTVDYDQYEGKYILFSSSLAFARRGDWSSIATLNLMRTNKKS